MLPARLAADRFGELKSRCLILPHALLTGPLHLLVNVKQHIAARRQARNHRALLHPENLAFNSSPWPAQSLLAVLLPESHRHSFLHGHPASPTAHSVKGGPAEEEFQPKKLCIHCELGEQCLLHAHKAPSAVRTKPGQLADTACHTDSTKELSLKRAGQAEPSACPNARCSQLLLPSCDQSWSFILRAGSKSWKPTHPCSISVLAWLHLLFFSIKILEYPDNPDKCVTLFTHYILKGLTYNYNCCCYFQGRNYISYTLIFLLCQTLPLWLRQKHPVTFSGRPPLSWSEILCFIAITVQFLLFSNASFLGRCWQKLRKM